MTRSAAKPRLLQALAGQKTDRPPVWFLRQAGRYLPEYRAVRKQCGSFLDLVFNPDAATEVTMQPIERFGFDAAILFSDILVTPIALGQKVWFAEGEGPRLGPLEEVDLLRSVEEGQAQEHLGPIMQTVAQIRSALSEEKALIGFAGAPWTVATYMVAGRGTTDQAPARTLALKDPERFQMLIDRLVDISVQYLSAQADAGADALMIFDSWAGVLSPDQFQRWVSVPTTQMVRRLKQTHPDVPIIGFPRGGGFNLEPYCTTGVDAVHIDETVPTDWAATHLQPHVCVQGNLDPRLMHVGGPAMEEQIRACLTALSGGAHIFNLGHGLTPDSDPDAVKRAVELAQNFRG